MKELKEYNPLKDYLNNELEYYPSEDEIEAIMRIASKQRDYDYNVGRSVSRIKHNDREKAFHDQWLIENEPVGHINNGHGILQDLFIDRQGVGLSSSKFVHIMTPQDRMIVATIIQWLGSNVGWCFLGESLKRCGYKITQIINPSINKQ